jgi:hypothetical protein
LIVTANVALSLPPEAFANLPVPDEDERLTVVLVPLVVRLLNGSSRETVNGFVALALWAAVNGLDVKTSLDGGAGLTVSTCVAGARPFDDAVIIGSPATVSP